MSPDALLAAVAAAPPLLAVAALALATLGSEDLTCVSAGVLVGAGGLDPWVALGGCLGGILVGDYGVWALGRWGGRTVLGSRLGRAVPPHRLDEVRAWLGRHGAATAVLSRFLPGTRVPTFFAAGASGVPAGRFLLWAAVAAVVWVPALVLAVAFLGGEVAGPLARALGTGAWAVPAAGLVGFGLVKVLPQLFCRTGRCRLRASVTKLRKYEFWPAWVFYLPIVPWYILLSARYRSFTVWTAANPGIPAGGVVGESKADIMARLDPRFTVRTTLVAPGPVAERVPVALAGVDGFPVILKPDAGQRGAGVRLARDRADVEKYLLDNPGAVIVQPFHPGPFEVGVFYYRLPGDERGRVFSVTDKVFPEVVGDGESTLAELVRAHPRYRLQEDVFLARHAARAGAVPAAGERLVLATAGNHCQGTLFRDGGHLLTAELERALDAAVQPFDGFFFGRFDVRYADPDEFRAGRGFAVIELNGVASESTNLYDPSWPLWRAYRTLFAQWALAFQIGAMNRARGHRPVGVVELLRLIRAHYRDRRISPLAD
ncbi:MAG: VTT domain-containing protein [Gemmataceae bacterium]|nr:VTT domain-containing protein [Gemmataceae bacterium]